jgi:integrase
MSGKRGNSEGTIRKRGDGRWEARYVDLDGKRRSLYCKTRQEVARLLAQAIRDREQGITALTERQTMGQYLASWVETVKHAVKAGSYVRYEQVVRLHLVPELGNVPLAKLTAQHVKALYAKKLSDGSSSACVRYMHILLHSALDGAMRLGLVHHNVADMVDKPRKRHREMSILSESQARALSGSVGRPAGGARCSGPRNWNPPGGAVRLEVGGRRSGERMARGSRVFATSSGRPGVPGAEDC